MSDLTVMLDTCALLYLASGFDKLSTHARRVIDTALLVLVSPVSAWEISLKVRRGQLVLPLEPEEWFSKAIEQHQLDLLPLSPEILMAANRLPWHHKDPADRFIIASALLQKAVVVSTDESFGMYDIHLTS